MTQVITSTISHKLDEVYDDFADEFGFGPCGAYAALKREQGWGDIAVCIATTSDMPMGFTHYVIWDDGIIDLANPLGEELTYTELEILNADELPELCDDSRPIDWLRARGI